MYLDRDELIRRDYDLKVPSLYPVPQSCIRPHPHRPSPQSWLILF